MKEGASGVTYFGYVKSWINEHVKRDVAQFIPFTKIHCDGNPLG